MKKVLITRADSNIKKMTDVTFIPMKEYAEKIGAEFMVLDHNPPLLTGDGNTHYRILKVRDILENYDRALLLDADMLINKDTPNIFDIVPEDKIGSIFEDKGSRKPDRVSKINNIQKKWGDVNWKEGYTNAGTFVLSKQHRDIFLPHKNQYWVDWGSADLHMSYMAHKFGYKIHELSFKWNHMTMFSEPWNNNANRFDSKIIHYAGGGIFDKGKVSNRQDQIISDYNNIYK